MSDQVYLTISDEINFVKPFPVVNHLRVWIESSSVHLYDELVAETIFTRLEEMVKLFDKLVEKCLNEFLLHGRGQHGIKWIMFYD